MNTVFEGEKLCSFSEGGLQIFQDCSHRFRLMQCILSQACKDDKRHRACGTKPKSRLSLLQRKALFTSYLTHCSARHDSSRSALMHAQVSAVAASGGGAQAGTGTGRGWAASHARAATTAAHGVCRSGPPDLPVMGLQGPPFILANVARWVVG